MILMSPPFPFPGNLYSRKTINVTALAILNCRAVHGTDLRLFGYFALSLRTDGHPHDQAGRRTTGPRRMHRKAMPVRLVLGAHFVFDASAYLRFPLAAIPRFQPGGNEPVRSHNTHDQSIGLLDRAERGHLLLGSTGSGGEAVEPVVQDSGFGAGERVRVTGKGGIQGRARLGSPVVGPSCLGRRDLWVR
jgi:hypothetical protein